MTIKDSQGGGNYNNQGHPVPPQSGQPSTYVHGRQTVLKLQRRTHACVSWGLAGGGLTGKAAAVSVGSLLKGSVMHSVTADPAHRRLADLPLAAGPCAGPLVPGIIAFIIPGR